MSTIETITSFEFNGQQLVLETSDLDEYIKWFYIQNAGDASWNSLTSREEKQQFANWLCKHRILEQFKLIPDPELNFSNIKKIIDVGSGVASVDLLLSQVLPDVDFYLLDKTDINYNLGRQPFFSKSLADPDYHGFYNSFDIVKDVIKHSPIDPGKIHFLDPADDWPNEVDLIISTFSWNWHYSKDVYWDKLMKSLKIGGYFSTTISLRKGENTLYEISADLGSYPCIYQPLPHTDESVDRKLLGFDQIVHTGYYTWQRMK